jgi:hypothetical protein
MVGGELPLGDIPHFPYRRRRRFSQLTADPANEITLSACRFSATNAASECRFSATNVGIRTPVFADLVWRPQISCL